MFSFGEDVAFDVAFDTAFNIGGTRDWQKNFTIIQGGVQ